MPNVQFPRSYVNTIQQAYVDSMQAQQADLGALVATLDGPAAPAAVPPTQAFTAYLACPWCMGLRFWITDPAWDVKLGGAIEDGMPLALPDGTPVTPGDVPSCPWCANNLSLNLSMHIVMNQPPDFEKEAARVERAW